MARFGRLVPSSNKIIIRPKKRLTKFLKIIKYNNKNKKTHKQFIVRAVVQFFAHFTLVHFFFTQEWIFSFTKSWSAFFKFAYINVKMCTREEWWMKSCGVFFPPCLETKHCIFEACIPRWNWGELKKESDYRGWKEREREREKLSTKVQQATLACHRYIYKKKKHLNRGTHVMFLCKCWFFER